MSKFEQHISDGELLVKDNVKRYIYDIIAAAIILMIIAASLHIFDIYDLTNIDDIRNFFIDWVPYFFATVLLNADLYEKGTSFGKITVQYIDAIAAYSKKAALTGDKLSLIGEFCIFYNEKTLREYRQNILRKEGIDYEEFNADFTKVINGETKNFRALKLWNKIDLDKIYGVNARKAIFQAKKASIKGISANILLSSFDIKDSTNIGATEKQLKIRRNISVTLRYFFTTLCMSVIFIKDISQWQWAGIIEVIFKLAYAFAKTLMSYFTGYNDITVNVVNHVLRKTDILNEFEAWYDNYSNTEKNN